MMDKTGMILLGVTGAVIVLWLVTHWLRDNPYGESKREKRDDL